ncbi:chorismate mutase [Pseudomonas gingeri]|uniref:Chorismate mutase n=1 Tax=Pseudomonas gingeri TaxID=117681 RepID=A0A7Y7XCL1_9PSED|nr:chorismate mutase [Pseudomonas gingeri]NWA28781.1 chorismate mutase [Pseudomonas gingeri]NWB97409.1 chorismate mutase [Pseudomonas gingeri]NWD66362.1 chorismate mutase [Pseudomonas gingeri]NWD76082.1 chorismate mutase [Pseudomonas gingeri]
MRLTKRLACPLLLLFLSTSAFAAAPKATAAPASLAPLLQAISERLDIADQVALTKWDSGKPIQDSPREQQVIANAAQEAATYQLNPEDVSQFLAAQIEANKLVQYALLAKWHAAGKAPTIARPDLVKQIRPALDQLQVRLLQHYAAFASSRQDPQCPAWLAKERQALSTDKVHDLALIRAVGELCISGH